MTETCTAEVCVEVVHRKYNIIRIFGLVGNGVSDDCFRHIIGQPVRQERLEPHLFIIGEGNGLVHQRSDLQSVCQYIVKPQHPCAFGLVGIQRYLILIELSSLRRVEVFFQRFSLGKCCFAHNIAIFSDEPLNLVNVPVKPALSLCIDQFGELPVQIAEISPELPLLLWSGSFFVGDTEPIQWY